MKTTVKLEQITPTKAKKWLTDLNYEDNRNIHDGKVAFLVRQILKGHWIVNGATICFDVEGQLIDGQHRLMACVRAKKPIQVLVVRGLATAAYTTIDQGWKRSHAQIFSARGEKWASILVGACRLAWMLENEGCFIKKRIPDVSIDELDLVLECKPEIKEAVALIAENKVNRLLTGGLAAYCGWLFLGIHEVKAIEFFTQLGNGANLTKKDPVLVLREKLLKARIEKTAWNAMEQFSFVVRAWNAHHRGRKLTQLRLTTVGRGGVKEIRIPELSGWK